jgi:release factor glutamine methyltransferase
MPGLSLISSDDAGALASLSTVPEFRPSEYTAALIQGVRARAEWARRAEVMEIGSGSGVVLGAIGRLGAASLCGVDIEGVAVASATFLLHTMGFGDCTQLYRGDMWRSVGDRRFGLIVANLPQFPMEPRSCGGRLPSWSAGGANGRKLLDRLIEGLSTHLSPGGRAIITHNGFVGLDRTRAMLAEDGLSLRVAATTLVHLPPEKLDLMTPAILCAEEGRSIYRYGPYAFAEMHVVEMGAGDCLD